MNPIITASLTGPAATKKDTPAMPGTPEEIAESAKGAYEAGAAVIHIHLRENDDFTADLDVARRTVELVREKCPGIVQLSTGGGMPYEDRMKIVEAKPAMATLNPATHDHRATSSSATRPSRCTSSPRACSSWASRPRSRSTTPATWA